MRIIDAVRAVDDLKPNQYTQEEKIRWLSSIDGQIQEEIINTHYPERKDLFCGRTYESAVEFLNERGIDSSEILTENEFINRYKGIPYRKYLAEAIKDALGRFVPYKETDTDKELIVKAPYDDIYISWLMAQIDFANGETSKYNNSMTMFNTKLQAFKNYYNRTHMPFGSDIKYW